MVRPGEKFKQKPAKRKGGGESLQMEATAEAFDQIHDDGDGEGSSSAGKAFGGAGCVTQRLKRVSSVDGALSTPLVLKTPRDASHLVK